MGPLYHLPDAADRVAALREAARVLAPAGLVAVAAISRYASALDGLARGLGADEAFVRIRDRDLRDGQHRNDTGRPDYFTTAYFHRPDDLREELEAAGFEDVGVLWRRGARLDGGGFRAPLAGPGAAPRLPARWPQRSNASRP